MDASLISRLQAQQVAAAHVVGTSLLPKNGARSGLQAATGLTGTNAAAQPRAGVAAAATGSTTGTGSSSSSSAAAASGATITSNDFLTLLVSELKNQDPTQPTDPNEYISQLTEVNSLEQLISINSGITSLDSAVAPTKTGTTSGSFAPAIPGTLAGAQVQHAKSLGETSFT